MKNSQKVSQTSYNLKEIASCQLSASAAPSRLGGGADDPAPERDKIALLGAEAAIDQVPRMPFAAVQDDQAGAKYLSVLELSPISIWFGANDSAP